MSRLKNFLFEINYIPGFFLRKLNLAKIINPEPVPAQQDVINQGREAKKVRKTRKAFLRKV